MAMPSTNIQSLSSSVLQSIFPHYTIQDAIPASFTLWHTFSIAEEAIADQNCTLTLVSDSTSTLFDILSQICQHVSHPAGDDIEQYGTAAEHTNWLWTNDQTGHATTKCLGGFEARQDKVESGSRVSGDEKRKHDTQAA